MKIMYWVMNCFLNCFDATLDFGLHKCVTNEKNHVG